MDRSIKYKKEIKLLRDNKHIAIIEDDGKNNKLNEAYIINGYNIKEYNIRNLLDKKCLTITSPYIMGNNIIKLKNDTVVFDDVYYEGIELYFFVFIEQGYYRFSFDIETGEIGKLIISK